MFITTSGGLYRYDMNDVIEVVGSFQNVPVVVFRRKGRGMTNLTGEKLSVNQFMESISRAAAATGTNALHVKAEPDEEASRYAFKVEFESDISSELAQAFLKAVDDSLSDLNIEWKGKRGSGRLKAPILQVMKSGWYDRGKQELVADGKRLFQAKTILLDAKATYQEEPEETVFVTELES